MKNLFYLLLVAGLNLNAQNYFLENFTGKTMRIDYILAGTDLEANAYFSKASIEDSWTGSRKNFREPFINGNYFFEIIDKNTGELLFLKSFNTLFGEWQTTREAEEMKKAFQQTAYFPCPKDSFLFRLNYRHDRAVSEVMMEVIVDPGDYLIPIEKSHMDYTDIEVNGNPSGSVDLLFIAEGYSIEEKEKYLADVARFSEYLFTVEPYSSYRDHFNIRALLSLSGSSGTDIPGLSLWKDTPAGTSFYTFGSERYLTTSEYWKIADLIKNIPHDQVLILVNTDKYGGGGIFNHYSVFTSDHPLSEIVFVHEFGHGFAGLGDEYYNSEVAYDSFYDLDREPLPPNLTTLVNFDSKWKSMVDENTPVPTPVSPAYKDKVGAFEGGGYVARGVYRPQVNCRMKSNETDSFCKVCQNAIKQLIKYYAE